MKVLLFMRNLISTPKFPDGDDRPKCVPTRFYERKRLATVPGWTPAHSDIGGEYDRWWLVECENAEAGRAIILRSERLRGPNDWAQASDAISPVPPGQILASGSRS